MSDQTSQFPEEFPELSRSLAEALSAKVPDHVRAVHEARLRELAQSTLTTPILGRPVPSRPRLMLVLAASLVMLMAMSAMAFAADDAIPGDLLYGVDRAFEIAQRTAARSPGALSEVLLRQADERVSEAEVSRASGRIPSVGILAQRALSTDDEAANVAAGVPGPSGLELINKVEDRRNDHIARLRSVRDKLEAGPAADRAVAALDSAIAKSEAKASGKEAKEHGAENGKPNGDPGPKDKNKDSHEDDNSADPEQSNDRGGNPNSNNQGTGNSGVGRSENGSPRPSENSSGSGSGSSGQGNSGSGSDSGSDEQDNSGSGSGSGD